MPKNKKKDRGKRAGAKKDASPPPPDADEAVEAASREVRRIAIAEEAARSETLAAAQRAARPAGGDWVE